MSEGNSSWTMSSAIRPLCPRHAYVMNYEEKGILWKEGPEGESQSVRSYHCDYFGCSVRYTPEEGYFTVVDTPDIPHCMEEPGTNFHQCPRHGTWMYRFREENSDSNTVWRCGVEGCDYSRRDAAILQAAS